MIVYRSSIRRISRNSSMKRRFGERERLLLQESHARAEAQVRRLEEHIRRLQEKNNPEVDLLNDMDHDGADWWKKGPVEE